MRASLSGLLGTRIWVFLSLLLVAVVTVSPVHAVPQGSPEPTPAPAPPPPASGAPAEAPRPVALAPLARPVAPDSFMTAPNDSVQVATAIAERIRKDQNRFYRRMENSGFGQFYLKGGVFMHPLLLCSIIGLVLCVERMWTLSRARINSKRFVTDVIKALRENGPESALVVCQQTHGPIAAVLHSGLLRSHRGAEAVEKAIATSGAIEMAFLERGLTLLASVSNVAPLLGFLGTVSGMIHSFAAIAAAEQVSAKLVAKGIEEALITTAAGLCIAVPISVFYSFFVMSIDRFIIEMEEASAELVDEMLDIEHKRGGMA